MTTRRALMSLALALTATVLVATAQTSPTPERALRAAVETEVIHGDVERALSEYRRLAAGTDRPVAAQALLRLARRQAIQGDGNARATYERVQREFADEAAAAAEATARLRELDEEQTGAQHRLLWDDAIDLWGGVSADGRWLSFVDWETGDLGLRDLTTGENRRLTDYGGYEVAQGEVEANIISPDGRRIAFTWDRWDDRAEQEGYFELRVIDADGSNERTLLRGREYAYLEPHAWAPDGSSIALQVLRPNPTARNPRGTRQGGEVVVINVEDRDVPVVASHGDARPWAIRYSPDGRWISYDLREGNAAQQGGPISGLAVVAADGSQQPALLLEAASNMGWSADGRWLLFSRDRMGTRELYAQAFAAGRLSGAPVKLKVAGDIGDPMGMTTDGRLFYGTTRRTADAALADYDPATGALSNLTFLRPVVGQVGVRSVGQPQFSPDGRRLAMVTGPSTVTLRDVDSGEEQLVLTAVPEIRYLRWAPDGRSLLLSGRDTEPGIFRVDLESQTTTLEFRTQTPVFAVSPDGSTLYYRAVGQPFVSARDRRTGETRTVAEWTAGIFDIVASPDGTTLALTGARRLVFVDLATGESTIRWEHIGPETFRVREGAWTADGQAFVTHFNDPEQRAELWTFAPGEEAPKRFPLDARYMGVSLSPDSRRLATMRVDTQYQLWVLENFLPPGAR